MTAHREWSIPVGTAHIHCETFGQGREAVLFLHGNGSTPHDFDCQYPAFAERYRVITMDSRGQGRSTFGGEPFSLARIADDIPAVLDALGETAVHVVGFSDGGNIGLLLALCHPERMKRFVCSGANLFPEGLKPEVLADIRADYRRQEERAPFDEAAARELKILGLMTEEPHISPASLKRVTVPTLIMAGDNDMISGGHTRLIARSLPNARLCIVPDSGHFTFSDQPEFVTRTMLDFLKEALPDD